ncbi:uncharacterized protein LOC114574924 [Exaiptasia diaphana]|uniref:Uncharacterized protein n=1 Tax=Exaiptasia diaphana TaxID=2652724 RepID=A0A913YHA2_EXADI|nr:uncharacterized protein LOC114574924 [Exaiptasia diaphana]
MMWYLIESGQLPRTHVFYEEVKAFCSRALSPLFSQENNFYQEFPALASWLQSNQFLHGKSATCFFNGIGGNKQGHLADQSMTPIQWINSHNFAGLSTRSITSMNPNHHLTNTFRTSDLLQLFSMLKHSQAISLKKEGMTGYLVVTATDAMAIKPGLQMSSQVNGLVGLSEPAILSLDEMKQISDGKSDADIASHLRNCKFNSQAQEVFVTSLDDIVSQPVAVYYGTCQGGWQTVDELHSKLCKVIDACESCIIGNEEDDCNFKCQSCWEEKSVCGNCSSLGLSEWHPATRPCLHCYNANKVCVRLVQLGWTSDCESKQKAFMERLALRYPETFQLPMPDPPHNIKSVRSAVFWYWLFLNNHLINVRMLLVIRRDSNPVISKPMKKAVTLKALKNKDRMSVETALEIFSPEVQRAIPAEDIVITIVPEVYTFWRQNRPGTVVGPLDVVVHQKTGTIFFTDRNANQIMMCNLHCPSMVTSVAGESRPGSRDGKNSLFHYPSGMCIYENLLFVCDSYNASIRVVDISRLVSRRSGDVVLDEPLDQESDTQEDAIPLTRKFTVTSTLKVVCTSATQLRKPFSICTGRKMDHDYPELYVGDIEQGTVFKLTDMVARNSCKGRLRKLLTLEHKILPMGLLYYKEELFIANAQVDQPSILVLHGSRGIMLRRIVSDALLTSPSGICRVGNELFVSCASHTIVKLSLSDRRNEMTLYCGQGNASGNQDGVVSSARLHSPHGLVNMGSSLIVCDTGNSSVRVISNGQPFKELSAVIYPYGQLFNLDHYRGVPRKNFTESFQIVDKLVEFLLTWGMQTQERTGRVSTQGPDQIITLLSSSSPDGNGYPYGGKLFLSDEKRRPYAYPTGIWDKTSYLCERAPEAHVHGDFHYYTGPKSYYPDKVINCRRPPVNDELLNEMDRQMEQLTIEDKQELREFSSRFGASVRQHTVRDKSKEETGCLPYAVSLDLQRREPGSTVSFLGESASSEATDQPLSNALQQYEVLFATRDVVAVKHARRREQFGFFLALVMKDLLVKSKSARELEFAEETVDFLWLDNSNSDNSLVFQEAYRDNKNSPYSIIDKVDIDTSTNDSGVKLYELPQSEVDRIERNLQGGSDSDIDSDNDSTSEEEDDRPPRECYSTRTGRAATRLRLS